MYKQKIDAYQFEKCQQLISRYARQKHNIPIQQILNFFDWAERGTIRMEANYKPLQNMIRQMNQTLIHNSNVINRPSLLAKATAIHCYLNLYSNLWMKRTAQLGFHMIQKGSLNRLEDLARIYHCFIQLRHTQSPKFINSLRKKLVNQLCNTVKHYQHSQLSSDSKQFSQKLENIHKHIRTLLIDPCFDSQHITPLLNQIGQTLQKRQKMVGKFKLDSVYRYHQTALCYQYLSALKVPINSQLYKNFLDQALQKGQMMFKDNLQVPKNQKNDKYAKSKLISQQQSVEKGFLKNKSKETNNKKPFFSRESDKDTKNVQTLVKKRKQYLCNQRKRSESVFQHRFQKNLHENGYQFDSNIRIGMHEFDLVIKGKSKELYRPFIHLNLEDLLKGKARAINKQQLSSYQRMIGMWNIRNNVQLQQPLVVNLNGPFHFICGDKETIVRSQECKRIFLKHYGYQQFEMIDYKIWQRQSQSPNAISDFFSRLVNKVIKKY